MLHLFFFLSAYIRDCTCTSSPITGGSVIVHSDFLWTQYISEEQVWSMHLPLLPDCKNCWCKRNVEKWDVDSREGNLSKKVGRDTLLYSLRSRIALRQVFIQTVIFVPRRSACFPTRWPFPRGASGSQGRMTTSTSPWWAPRGVARGRCWTRLCTMTLREER